MRNFCQYVGCHLFWFSQTCSSSNEVRQNEIHGTLLHVSIHDYSNFNKMEVEIFSREGLFLVIMVSTVRIMEWLLPLMRDLLSSRSESMKDMITGMTLCAVTF